MTIEDMVQLSEINLRRRIHGMPVIKQAHVERFGMPNVVVPDSEFLRQYCEICGKPMRGPHSVCECRKMPGMMMAAKADHGETRDRRRRQHRVPPETRMRGQGIWAS